MSDYQREVLLGLFDYLTANEFTASGDILGSAIMSIFEALNSGAPIGMLANYPRVAGMVFQGLSPRYGTLDKPFARA